MIGQDRVRLILDGSVLREEFLPPDLTARQAQVKLIAACLEPAKHGRKPTHVWLYGSPGSGKTVCARAVLERMSRESGIGYVVVNCWQRNSLYEILDQIVAELKIFHAEQHRSSVKQERLRRHLGSRRLIILLDEIDKMPPVECSKALYALDDLNNVGLICISSTLSTLFDLEDRVRSRISPRTIHFGPYSAAETLEILTSRANLALAPGACPAYLLKRIAGACSGDARVAIKILRNVAESAESANRDRVQPSDLASAWDDTRRAKTDHILARLTEDHRILYRTVSQHKEILSTDLRQLYLQHCSYAGRTPVAVRTFSAYVNRLTRLGLVACERARIKGNVRLLRPSDAGCQAIVCARDSPGKTGKSRENKGLG